MAYGVVYGGEKQIQKVYNVMYNLVSVTLDSRVLAEYLVM